MHSVAVLLADVVLVGSGLWERVPGYHLLLFAACALPYARLSPREAAKRVIAVTLVDDLLWGPLAAALGFMDPSELPAWLRLQYCSLGDWSTWWWADLLLLELPVSPALMGWSIALRLAALLALA